MPRPFSPVAPTADGPSNAQGQGGSIEHVALRVQGNQRGEGQVLKVCPHAERARSVTLGARTPAAGPA
eukprot:15451779-Alexandrium_andersonii.AAC.1